jgi:hypothetical protein
MWLVQNLGVTNFSIESGTPRAYPQNDVGRILCYSRATKASTRFD